jgi:hypothetical protein
VGLLLPVVGFNNDIVITFASKAAMSIVGETTPGSYPNYGLAAKVYLRMRDYPHSLLTKTPHAKVIFSNTKVEHSEKLILDSGEV